LKNSNLVVIAYYFIVSHEHAILSESSKQPRLRRHLFRVGPGPFRSAAAISSCRAWQELQEGLVFPCQFWRLWLIARYLTSKFVSFCCRFAGDALGSKMPIPSKPRSLQQPITIRPETGHAPNNCPQKE
jgi:hypothetical protein